MIDLNTEDVVSLTEATTLLPRRRGGRKCHVATLYRWSIAGCRGVILETLQIGGTRCTSKQALARFFRRLSEIAGTLRPHPTTPARRRRAAEQAMRDLQREGV
jgi:hypothetical protein